MKKPATVPGSIGSCTFGGTSIQPPAPPGCHGMCAATRSSARIGAIFTLHPTVKGANGGDEVNAMAMHLVPFTLGALALVALVAWLLLLH